MRETYLSRADETGTDAFDSIKWAYETHVKRPDNPEAKYAILYGTEDCPERIEFFSTDHYEALPCDTWRTPPEAETRNYLNGMSVLGFYKDAVYIRIPREIAADITHGCACDYCKAHPEITPKWDTLCVDLKPRHAYGHTWTVHMPEYNHLLKGTRTGK